MENNRLHLLLGPPLEVRTALQFMGGANQAKKRANQFESGHTLVAWDLQTNRELWRHEEKNTIDYHTVAVRDGRVYFYSEQKRLVCLGADGKEAWAFDQPEFISRLPRPSRFANINTEATSTLIVGPKGTLRFAIPGRAGGFIFDSAKGALLWEDKLLAPKCFFLDWTYLSPSGVFDAFTGSKVGDTRVTGSGCGIMKWGPGLDEAVNHTSFGVKSPCGVGAFAAEGLLHFAPSQCDCWPLVRGGVALTSGGTIFETAAKGTHPLVKGNAPASKLAASAGDWPEYRGGGMRRGVTMTKTAGTATMQAVVKVAHALPVPEGHDMHRIEWLDPAHTARHRRRHGLLCVERWLRARRECDGGRRGVDLLDRRPRAHRARFHRRQSVCRQRRRLGALPERRNWRAALALARRTRRAFDDGLWQAHERLAHHLRHGARRRALRRGRHVDAKRQRHLRARCHHRRAALDHLDRAAPR